MLLLIQDLNLSNLLHWAAHYIGFCLRKIGTSLTCSTASCLGCFSLCKILPCQTYHTKQRTNIKQLAYQKHLFKDWIKLYFQVMTTKNTFIPFPEYSSAQYWQKRFCLEILNTLRWLLKGREVKISRGGGGGDGGWNFKKIANIGNAWQNRHECLILMLSLKVNKQEVKLVRTR